MTTICYVDGTLLRCAPYYEYKVKVVTRPIIVVDREYGKGRNSGDSQVHFGPFLPSSSRLITAHFWKRTVIM